MKKVLKKALSYLLLAVSKVCEYAGKALTYLAELAKKGSDKLDEPEAPVA